MRMRIKKHIAHSRAYKSTGRAVVIELAEAGQNALSFGVQPI
jgi:hypothetical protein